jgi:hypothetical protein
MSGKCSSDSDIRAILNSLGGLDGTSKGTYTLESASKECAECTGSIDQTISLQEKARALYNCLPKVSKNMCSQNDMSELVGATAEAAPTPQNMQCAACYNKFKMDEIQKVCSADDFSSPLKIAKCWKTHGSDIMSRLDDACGDPDNPVETTTTDLLIFIGIIVFVIVASIGIYKLVTGRSSDTVTKTTSKQTGSSRRRRYKKK